MTRLNLAACLSTLALTACADSADGGPTGPRLAVAVAPLTLPGVMDACYALTTYNGPAGTGEVVWQRANICADAFGDGEGSITYIGTCDASVATDNSVRLVLEDLYANTDADPQTAEALVAPDDYVNPCPAPTGCVLDAPCEENADTPVVFNLTIMRRASQGFFDVAVDFEDIFCSAKLDCTYDDAGQQPIRLLFDGDTRGRTVVLGLACTGGPGVDTHVYLNHVDLHCGQGEGEVIFTVDPTFGPGNLSRDPASGVPNDLLFEAAVYEGYESLQSGGVQLGKRYWNLALGVRQPDAGALGLAGDLTNCHLHAEATAHDGEMVGGITPTGSYPYIHWSDVPLNTTGGLTCTRHQLDDGGPLETLYTAVGTPMSFQHVLATTYDANDLPTGVTTDHVVRDADGTSDGALPHGELRAGKRIHHNDQLGATIPGDGDDLADWWYFSLPAADDLTVALTASNGVPAHLAAADLRYQLFRAPDLATVLLAGDADDAAQTLANAAPGTYYMRVYLAAPTANPDHSEVHFHAEASRP